MNTQALATALSFEMAKHMDSRLRGNDGKELAHATL
jgi:hypothetical protein